MSSPLRHRQHADAHRHARRLPVQPACCGVPALSGLEFPPNEFKAYAAGLQPKALNKWPGADLATVQAIAARLAAPGAAAADFAADEASLAAVQGLLSNLWRWRRRGGGSLDGEDQRPHQAALEQLHGVQKAAENIDKTSSVILDQLDISDEDKKARLRPPCSMQAF